jgi:L-lysine 6-transaminase
MLADGMEMVLDLEKSHGSYIHDSLTGKDILDFFSFFASAPVGHNHPKLTTPEFLERLGKVAVNNVTNSDLYTIEMAAFVDTFAEIAIPDHLPHLFMIAGGGLGVENALKAAFDWKVQKNFEKGYSRPFGNQVLHFQNAFHGRTGYTLSLTNTSDKRKHKWFAKFDWPRVLNPSMKFPQNKENIEAVEKLEQLAVNQIKIAIKERGDDIAALIIEPIQGEGGDNHFREEFMNQLRQICDENEIFLVYDEVQTGVGLTGKMWCHEHFPNAKPDALAFGKKMQVCGTLISKRIEEVERHVFVESSRLNSTWGGNLIDMVRAGRYLEIIKEENLVENAAKMGTYTLNELEKLAGEFPNYVSNVRGRGLMIAFDVCCGDDRNKLLSKCFKNGLACLGCGDQSVRFRPSLNISAAEIDQGIDILRKSLKEMD